MGSRAPVFCVALHDGPRYTRGAPSGPSERTDVGRLLLWVLLAAVAILVVGAVYLMVATPKAGTHHVEKVVPLEKLAR